VKQSSLAAVVALAEHDVVAIRSVNVLKQSQNLFRMFVVNNFFIIKLNKFVYL
jgi:hypothetical protein